MPSEGSSSSKKSRPPNKIDEGNYTLDKKLGAGCFGEVYGGTKVSTGDKIAIKTEDCRGNALQLEQEAGTLKYLTDVEQPPQGIAKCHYYGTEKGYNFLVMEMLGKSIEDMVQKCKGKFTPKTTVLVAQQVLRRIEYFHSRCLIHRDIKPENFMFGIEGKIHHVYIIDFGLSKKYFDKQHSPMRQKLSLTGTARYASINAHKGLEQSRRDDLEAIGHMFLYFLCGQLPWSGLDAKTKEEKYRKIMEKKATQPLDELCKGYPPVFQKFIEYARNLEFTERPNYDRFHEELEKYRGESNASADWDFEWLKAEPPNYTALDKRVPLRQPDDVEPPKAKTGNGAKKKTGSRFCFCGGKSAVSDD